MFSGLNDADVALASLLDALDRGRPPSALERLHVDVKEEPGRRTPDGSVLDVPADLEQVARMLHQELGCMANTPGGGAIVLGIADDGARPGATVGAESLRHRIYELSQRRLTPDVTDRRLADGTRVLVCRVLQALEPIRVNGRIRWRVADNCVEIDPATWFGKLAVDRNDWSAEPSDRSIDDISSTAVNEVRRLLQESGDPSSVELAALPDLDLLRRLPNVLLEGDRLSNGGRLLLTDNPVALDYVHRPAPGSDSTIRVERAGPVIVQLRAVMDAIEARARTVHVPGPGGAAVGQFRALPERPVREALLNGLLHRDWHTEVPTRVEHVGDTVRVVSPGGLVGAVTPRNIITHPSTPRHRALMETATKIRLVEREGIGVDRMYADLIALGRPSPIIEESDGPAVHVTLIGGDPDLQWIRLRQSIEPSVLATDLNVLLALDLVSRVGWVSASSLAPVIQDHEEVAADTLKRVAQASTGTDALIVRVEGRPAAMAPMYRLSAGPRQRLGARATAPLSIDERPGLLLGYAREGGRISTTEASDLIGISPALTGETLKQLLADGELRPSSPSGVGRGFHYRPASP